MTEEKKTEEWSVEQIPPLTIFLIAALEWLAAVEISSSASAMHIYTYTNVSLLAENPDYNNIMME